MTEKQIVAKVHARLMRRAKRTVSAKIAESHKHAFTVQTVPLKEAYYTRAFR